MKKETTIYDIIIIGSGISGLYSAYKIQKLNPHLTFLILEKYKKQWIGGRTSSEIFYNTTIATGAGIGRADTNPLLLKLMKDLDISYSIKNVKMDYSKSIENPIDPVYIILFLRKEYKKNPNLHDLPFKEFAEKMIGKDVYQDFLISTGYQDYEKADLYETLYHYGMDDTKGGWPMICMPWKKIVLTLAEKIGWNHFCFHQKVEQIEKRENIFELNCENGNKYFAEKIIIASTIDTIKKLVDPLVKSMKPIYKQIHSQPFLRLYGKFDKKSAEIMETLVPNYTIVPGPLQKIIPIDKKKGVYMVAYCDNKNALTIHKHYADSEIYKKYISNLICKAIGIPKDSLTIIGIKEFFWEIGTHYYEPLHGLKSRKEFLSLAQHPMKNILVVGEAVSMYQGWVEGALESVEAVINKKTIDF